MLESQVFSIDDAVAGERLDKALSLLFPNKSRTYFHFLINNGFALVNGSIVKKRTIVKEGDEVEIIFHLPPEISLEPENIPLDILYEDEYILAINKPAGMVVHPAPGNWNHTFVNALLYHCKNFDVKDTQRPGIVHRLDKETSGVLLAAKTLNSQQNLIDAFSNRKVNKTYIGICYGNPTQRIASHPIGRHPTKRKEMTVRDDGKEAVTHIYPLARNENYLLALFKPITGRTHQIRVHCKKEKAPILGDSTYGPTNINQALGLQRQLLHALQIELEHPITKKLLKIHAPLPEEFKQAIQRFFQTTLSSESCMSFPG